jgi:hypothetical protein
MKRFVKMILLAVPALALLIGLSAGAANAPAGQTKPASPRTVVSEKAPIRSFAQDAGAIAWISRSYAVHVRSLRTGVGAVVGSARPGVPVDVGGPGVKPDLALGETRALWTKFEGGNSMETSLWTSALGGGATGLDVFMTNSGDPGGIFLTGLAGDGPTLLYGKTFEGCNPPPWPPAPCPSLEATGGVSIVTGQYEQPPVSGIPAAAMIAFAAHNPQSGKISQGRLAVVPAASPLVSELSKVPRVVANGPVQVYWFLNKLVLASSVTPRGTVKAIALSFPGLAVLVQRADGTKAIERYAADGGALLATSSVPRATPSALSISSAGIVYRVGNKIYLLAGRSPKLVWKASGTPIGLSIEGKRIAWAENVKGRGRIVALAIR